VIAELHPPLRYAGRTFRADKEFFGGTHRAMPPEETLERIQPHLGLAGITRVADITGLDTLGLPVTVAIRPPSGTLAVEGGKGVSLAAAFASAAMEGIERFVGESDPVGETLGTVAEVADSLPVSADRLPMFRYASVSPDRRYAWTHMHDLRTGRECLAPRDLVSLPTGEPGVSFSFPWAAGSNGLASGNNLPEAVCAALYEVIERDATSCWQLAHRRGTPRLVVDPETIDGPVIAELLEMLGHAGVDAQIAWCPTDVEVPTCLAHLVDRRPGMGVYKGYGCHLDPEIAMIRAVTEAVQSRTIFVAGSRDDLLRPMYEALKRSDVLTPTEFREGARLVSVSEIPNRATSTFHGDVAVMVELLGRAGLEHVLVRELDASAFEVAVARVLVPGLEPYQFQWVAAGERALRFEPEQFVG
jgi:ribosomal protein S12 methylthiotransferase accessory factor